MRHDDLIRSAKINLTKNQNSEDLDALKGLKKRENVKLNKTYLRCCEKIG